MTGVARAEERSLESLEKLSQTGRTADVYLWEATTALKLARSPGFDRAFEREALALDAAAAVKGLAPEFRGMVTIDGRPGLLMGRLAGIDLLKELEKRPWRVWPIGRELAEEHARLHSIVAPSGMETVRERIASRLGSDLVPGDIRHCAESQLSQLPDGDRLCHGDFHPGNLMRTADGLKVIDFAGACAGDPDADFATTLCLLELGEPPPGTPRWMRLLIRLFRRALLASYRRRYNELRKVDADNLRSWRRLFLAQRLADNIPEERSRILARLR